MLEIKHLSKIYKTKGGVETRALDDVSINFASTGLVFLLGKSGSGKSTLLNLAGGLDEPTSGEIIVMGKSSKDFSGSDFDSYRNTYVGFVFQEYNILNEFNVEDNIGLALELQGKKKDKEKIAKLLEEVELTTFAKRKPNTLSGGQKQRIAIARALIKDPQIIMADEPTGALDSTTGKQVMETLKKLSKTRLVLVVSHDREFAELYGDRIVELKDGKVISDVTKVHSEATVSGNIIKLSNDTITVKKGAKLTANDVQTLQKFISEGDGDVLVSKNDKDIANFKRANRIDDEGRRESFAKTPTDSVQPYSGDKAKFIRSRLPASKAIKIGASGLKLKPFRLILTILLSIISFVMFGLFSTMMLYNPEAVMIQSFLDSDYEYLTVQKYYEVHVSSQYDKYSYSNETQLTPAEVASFGNGAFGAYQVNSNSSLGNVTVSQDKANYYKPIIYRIAVLPANHPLRSAIQGQYPNSADEIVVSSYLLDCIKNAQFRTVEDKDSLGSELQINSASDLIGQNVFYLQTSLKVTGVFESGAIPSKYNSLLENVGNVDYLESYRYEQYLQEGMHALAFVSEEFVEQHSNELGGWYGNNFQYFDNTNTYFEFYSPYQTDYPQYSSWELRVYDTSSRQLEILLLDDVTTLSGNQVIIPLEYAKSFVNQWYWTYSQYYSTIFWEDWNSQHQPDNYENWDEYYAAYEEADQKLLLELKEMEEAQTKFENAVKVLNYGEISDVVWVEDDYWGGWYETIWRKATAEEIGSAKQIALDYLKQHTPEMTLRIDGALGDKAELVGVYLRDEYNWANGFYCSQSLYDQAEVYVDYWKEETKYEREADAKYDYVLVPFDKTEATLKAIFAKLDVVDEQTDISFRLNNSLASNVYMANDLVETLSTVFLWVGVGLAVFASLLLFNFISVSISGKKKEIGILRAVGARGTDVFKIFFAESSIIVGICLVLSIIGTGVLATVINGILKADAGLDVALFVFGPLSVAVMIGVALLVTLVSTFLPVHFAARKKPVESIRAL